MTHPEPGEVLHLFDHRPTLSDTFKGQLVGKVSGSVTPGRDSSSEWREVVQSGANAGLDVMVREATPLSAANNSARINSKLPSLGSFSITLGS